MNNIRDIPEESIRQLATTLKESGLAASETEAIRMAMSMSHTNSKVSQTFEDRKEKNIMGLSHLNKKNTGNSQETQKINPEQTTNQDEGYKLQQDKKVEVPKTAEQIVEEQRNIAENSQSNSFIQQNTNEDIDLSNITLEEAASGHINTAQPEAKEQPVETIEEPREDISIEFKEDEEFIVQDVIKSAPETNESSEAEQTQIKSEPAEQTTPNTPERKPKRDISEMEESKVDLGAVFNFGSK